MVRKKAKVYKNIQDVTYAEMEEHQGMVKELSLRYYRFVRDVAVDLDDMISEANIALLRAFERFDSSKGFQFSTFAYCMISDTLKAHISRRCQPIRFPEPIVYMANEILKQDLLHLPDKIISEQLNVSIRDVVRAKECVRLRFPMSFERNIHSSVDTEITSYDKFFRVEDDLSNVYVEELLQHLSDRNRKICLLRIEGLTFKDIGHQFDLTKSRIEQIFNQSKVSIKNTVLEREASFRDSQLSKAR